MWQSKTIRKPTQMVVIWVLTKGLTREFFRSRIAPDVAAKPSNPRDCCSVSTSFVWRKGGKHTINKHTPFISLNRQICSSDREFGHAR